MSSNLVKDFTVKYTDVETSRISSTELQENERSKGQKLAYPKYNHPKFGIDQPLIFQFPWVRLETYGVPRAGEYFKNDSDRTFVKLPLNNSIPETEELTKKCKEIDKYFSSEEFASKLLGKKWNKYTYQPIIRESISYDNDDDDDNENSKKKLSKQSTLPKYPYLKLKIDTDYTSGEIKTKLYRSEMIDNKRTRIEIQDIKTIDDFARVVCFQSNFRPIVRLVKFWAQPLTKKDPAWGATFKIIKGEVEPPTKGNSLYKDYMNSDAFLDSDEETTNAPSIPVKKVKQVESDESDEKPKSPKKVAQIESDDDSEEEKPKIVKKVAQIESDDDSEEEKPKIVKKIAQVESDDDSEEEKPKIVKKIAQVESDDDSEEEKPKIVKKVAQVESDDDSKESEEEKPQPPIKKPVSKTNGRGGKSKST
jgi:hypothetical protein